MKKPLIIIVILCFIVAMVCGCGKNGEVSRGFDTFEYFGTEISVRLYCANTAQAKNNADAALEKMRKILADVDKALSLSKPDSDLSRFNDAKAGESVVVSKYTADCFKIAQKVYRATDGAYNPTVYPLVDLWGFSARRQNDLATATPPDAKLVQDLKPLLCFDEISLQQATLTLTKPATEVTAEGKTYTAQMDFGGVGKGYACDLLKRTAAEYGIKGGYVNVGSSSITFLNGINGKNVDVDVESPRREKYGDGLATVKNAQNSSVSVSGDYQRYFDYDGKRYCHIIDANTGAPTMSGLCNAFVIADSAAVCDAVTTALMVMGKTKAALFCGGKEFERLGCKTFLVTEDDGKKLNVVSDKKLKINNHSVVLTNFDVYDGDVTFYAKNDNVWLWCGIGLCVGAIAAIVILSKKNARKKEESTQDFSQTKLFKKGDIVVYVLLAVCISALFCATLIPKRGQTENIDVYVDGKLVYRYDCKTSVGAIKNSAFADRITQTTTDGVTKITIYVDETQKDYNVIEFFGQNAKIIDANCIGKDCAKKRWQVSKAGDATLCIPHKLKVVGVGKGNQEVS